MISLNRIFSCVSVVSFVIVILTLRRCPSMGFVVVVVVVIFITNNNIANTTLVAITTLAQDEEEAVDCGGALRGGALHYPSHDWL